MVIFMGGLLSISRSLYEAASVDGANEFQQFFRVTLPMMVPTSLVVIILGMIDMFKTYPLVLNLTGGGPAGTTKYIVQYIFETGFVKYKYGYASAVSLVLLLVIAGLSALQLLCRKEV